MNALISLHHGLFAWIQAKTHILLPTLARLIFAAVLFRYFWNSALTKLDGLFTPSLNAYAQIWPKAMEAAGYDVSQMSGFQTLVVLGGTYAEFILPIAIVVGLFTRLASLAMIGFVFVQSLTDIYGHGAASGAWFDGDSASVIVDQRTFWVFVLLVLVIRGAGPFSLDTLLARRNTA